MAIIQASTGLELTEDKLRIDPGTLQDCRNYEVAYHSGYRRIDGFLRFDGRAEQEDLSAYRALVQKAPGGPAYGLHFFTDRSTDQSWLYAVVETARVELDSRGITAENLNVSGQRAEIALEGQHTGTPNCWILEPNASFAGESRDLMEILSDTDFAAGKIRAYTRVDINNGVNMPTAGQQIEDPNSTWIATVRGVEQISGTALGGDIVAVIWVEIDTDDFVAADAELRITGTTDVVGNASDITGHSDNGVYAGSISGAATDLDATVNKGVLIRSSDRGWEPVLRSYEANFKTGTNEPPNVFTTGTQISETETPSALPADGPGTAYWDEEGHVDWDVDDAAMQSAIQSDDGSYVQAEFTADGQKTEYIRTSDYSADIDELDEITGVEVELIVEREGAAGGSKVEIDEVLSTLGAKRGQGTEVTDAKLTITLGGPFDLWGANSADHLREELQKGGFGWLIRFRVVDSTDLPTQVRVHVVRRTIYLREGSLQSRVYLRSGGTDTEARIIYTHVQSGDWAGNDAAGIMTFARIDNPADVAGNAEVRTEAGGGGNLIARLDGELTPIRLPSRDLLDEKSSRFQFIDTNFFAAGRLSAVYGVSGADHAFTFNNQYLFRIRTGRSEDEPRHVARHGESLVLGYENGDADVSVPTNPDLFDGALGAFTLGFGRRVTGLLPLAGDTLGVWTEDSTYAVQGITSDTAQQTVIAPTTGAIEYTVADMGIPIFCDFRGINTLAASQNYGDFDLGRLSRAIRAWLLPRVADDSGAKRPVMAQAVRKKNQYRLWFADGEILTLTWLEDQKPRFTWQRWWLDGNKTAVNILASAEGVDENGESVSFASFTSTSLVYRTDYGESFDGQDIDAHITFNPAHVNGPGMYQRVNIGHVHAIVDGTITLETQLGVNYATPAGRKNNCKITGSGGPSFGKFRHKARGRDFALKIISSGGDGVAPHTIQMVEFPDLSIRKLER